MLLPLPRLGLLGGNEPGNQGIEALMRLLELLVYETQAGDERGDVGTGGLDRTGGNLYGRLSQHIKDMCGVEAPDAIALRILAIVPSRIRTALSGVGTVCHKSSSHSAPRSSSSWRIAGK